MTGDGDEQPGGVVESFRWALAEVAALDRRSLFYFVSAAVLLTIYRYQGSTMFFRQTFEVDGHWARLYPYVWWFCSCFVLLLIVPVALLKFVLGEDVGRFGLRLHNPWFDVKAFLFFYVLMLPLIVLASRLAPYEAKYPFYALADRSVTDFVVYEFFYGVQFIGWEFFFRGFLLFGLARRFGTYAVFIQAVPFVLMHFGKPQSEVFGSLLAGIGLGFLALRTRSIWAGVALHFAVAMTLDLLFVLR